MSKKTKPTIIYKGRTFKLTAKLNPKELEYINSQLGPYKKLVFAVKKEVVVTNTKPSDWLGETEIGLIQYGNKAKLCVRQGYSGNWYFGD